MLRDDLKDALKQAMRAKEARRTATIRLILAAIKDRDIAQRTETDQVDDDAQITEILSKMVKQRFDSIKAYEEGGRCELAEQEREEIEIIEAFLPRQMDAGEISDAVDAVLSDIDASGLKDMGRCMGELKKRYAGQMDFAKASAQVKERLG